jgi:hypothetical protein
MKTLTLKQFVERKLTNGFIACSKNISDSGYLKIDFVMNDWWIRATDGRSYSCCPSELVYFNK